MAYRKALLAPDRNAPGDADHALALAKAVLAPDLDALGGADHALALASCRVTTAEATATVDDSVDPGRRLHCDHKRPSGAVPGARLPAKLESFREHSLNRCYAALALGAAIACRFSCRNAPTQHLLVSHGLPGLIAHGRSRAIVGALYRLRKELSYTDELGVGRVQVSRWRERYCRLRLAGIERDLPRGAPLSTVDVVRLVELTTQSKPEAATHWSTRTMAAELGVSGASVSRYWRANGLKPHLVRGF